MNKDARASADKYELLINAMIIKKPEIEFPIQHIKRNEWAFNGTHDTLLDVFQLKIIATTTNKHLPK